MRFTSVQFHALYPDDDTCLQVLFERRYGETTLCPACKKTSTFYRVRRRQSFACKCGHQIFPLSGTIFRKTTTPLTLWFHAIYLFSVSKNGVAATELERQLGVTYKTAWRMCKQIRLLMEEESAIGGSGRILEADETYYGPKKYGRNGMYNKTPILGVVERGGAVRVVITDTASSRRAKTFLRSRMLPDSELHTDESSIYRWVHKEYTHETVNHSIKQYAKGPMDHRITTNTIEGFWGILKRSISGTYYGVSQRHLAMYAYEFAFRYSHRHELVFPLLLERAATVGLPE